MRSVTFGPFRFDLDTRELHRSGIAVRLQRQPAKLLALLVERAGELVTRDEIRRTVWGTDTFVDFDQSVNFCVRQIRTALHDNADAACYVETLPRRGYRFIAPVQPVGNEPAIPAHVVTARAARSMTWPRLAIASVVVLITAIAAGRDVFKHVRGTGLTGSTAYQEVELGKFFLNKFNPGDAQRALEHFEAATREDPEYAPAYAGLAETYNQLASVFIAAKPPANARLLALRAAMRAIELDSTLAEAYAALGYTTMHEMDWARAETALRRGIELNPRNVPARLSYASYLAARRRFKEAIDEARRGVDLEPASLRARRHLAWMLYFDRQHDAAIRELRAVLQMDPGYAYGHFGLGEVLLVTRHWEEAIAELKTAVDLTHRAPGPLGLLAMAYGGGGERAEAQRIVDELERRSTTETVPSGAVLLAYLGIDDKVRAIDALARGYTERDNYEINIAADPLMDPLRGEPRFEALCQQVMRGTRLTALDTLMPERSLAQR